MKLGVDARPLSLHPTGIGRYTYEILSRLKNESLLLYSDRPIHATAFPNATVPFNPHFPLIKSVVWQQMFLPRQLKKTSPQLFWSPRHHLPLYGCNKTPKVVSIHDLVYLKFPHTMPQSRHLVEKLLLPASVKKAEHIITVSEASKQDLIQLLNIAQKKITVIHSGFSPLQAQDPSHIRVIERPYIFFLGTLEPRKNIARLIQAYLALPSSFQKEYLLVLAGGRGWIDQTLFNTIKALEAKGKVRYLAYVETTQIDSLMQHAACFAFPSLYEGFGLPLLEAMRAGTPVLTSTDPACMEVSGSAALHADPYSVESITSALQAILENKMLRNTLVQKGYDNLKRFSWDRASLQHLKIFKEFANENPSNL